MDRSRIPLPVYVGCGTLIADGVGISGQILP